MRRRSRRWRRNNSKEESVGGSRKKFREGVAKGAGDNGLGRTKQGTHGAQPGAEVTPDEGRMGGGEALQETLGDESDLDVTVIGVELAANGGAI